MKSGENINVYYTRVTNVANQMKMYGDEIKKDVVNNTLSIVTKACHSAIGVIESWKPKKTCHSNGIRGDKHHEGSR